VKAEDQSAFRKACVLRWILVFASLGWGISFWFTFVPWKLALAGLVEMGARPLPFGPFLDYWMRVVGMTFGLFGIGCFVLAVQWERYAVIVPLVGWFHLLVGGGSLLIALTMEMSIFVYPTLAAEIVFSIVTGVMLLIYTRSESSFT